MRGVDEAQWSYVLGTREATLHDVADDNPLLAKQGMPPALRGEMPPAGAVEMPPALSGEDEAASGGSEEQYGMLSRR